MTTINSKMGLKPRTRTRAATHGPLLVSRAQCPKCDGRHVIRSLRAGPVTYMCGFCSHRWEPTEAPDAR